MPTSGLFLPRWGLEIDTVQFNELALKYTAPTSHFHHQIHHLCDFSRIRRKKYEKYMFLLFECERLKKKSRYVNYFIFFWQFNSS